MWLGVGLGVGLRSKDPPTSHDTMGLRLWLGRLGLGLDAGYRVRGYSGASG